MRSSLTGRSGFSIFGMSIGIYDEMEESVPANWAVFAVFEGESRPLTFVQFFCFPSIPCVFLGCGGFQPQTLGYFLMG